MPYVKTLRSNVKGEFEHELGPLTLVVGKNKSGKSRVVEALSLVLTGQTRDERKRGVDVLSLKPSADPLLYVEAMTDEGEPIEYRLSGSTAKAHQAEWAPKDRGVLLYDEASAILRSDAKALRATILARIGAHVDTARLRETLPAALWDRLLDLIASAGVKVDGTQLSVDGLLEVLDALDAAKRQAAKSQKEADAAAAAGIAAEPLSSDEEQELTELRAKIAAQGVSEDERARAVLESGALGRELLELDKSLVSLGDPRNVLGDEDARLAKDALSAAHAMAVRLSASEQRACRCPLCLRDGATLDTFRSAVERFGAILEQSHKAEKLLVRKAEVEARLATLRHYVEVRHSRADAERLSLLAARQDAARNARAASATAQELGVRVAELKALRKSLDLVVAKTLDDRATSLVAQINSVLPRGMTFQLELRDGTRSVCRLGIDGRDLRALSGAERAALVSAFASVAGPRNGAAVRLLVVDDVWLDSDMLGEVLRALREALEAGGPTQVVLCAVSDSGVPDAATSGWTVIRLGG